MSETKHKNRKTSRKNAIKIIVSAVLFVLFLIVGLLIYFTFSNKPLFISPLPINYKLNSSSDKDDRSMELKSLLKEKNISYNEIVVANNNLIVILKDKAKIIFSPNKDLPTQLASLQFILTRLTMESKGFKELDLRFDKPVIRQ
ncbi:MAG TPA: hypothetical protein VM077_01615 [Candidatus Limnocylindrales bacterium]|nr:hypothetical protein [Candidatus Limnocylindrales bacterium]